MYAQFSLGVFDLKGRTTVQILRQSPQKNLQLNYIMPPKADEPVRLITSQSSRPETIIMYRWTFPCITLNLQSKDTGSPKLTIFTDS